MKKIISSLLVLIILCGFVVPIEASTGVSFYNKLCPIVGYGWENEDFPTYTTVDCTTKSGSIYASDKCTITKVYINSDGKWVCKVKYPLSSGGTKTAYAKFGRFIKNPTYNYQTIVANKTVKTSTISSSSASSSNSIAEGSTFYVVRIDGSKAQALYKASDCYKLGWINNYTIKFDANNGSGAPSSFTKVEGETANIPTTVPTRKGYTFKGWNLEKDGSGSSYKAGGTIGKNSSVTLYAQWEATKYTLSYNYNGGTASNPASYYITTATFTLNNPTKKGYTFIGWTGSNGSSASKSVSIAKGSTGNKSYTANYNINSYNITAVPSDSSFGSVSGGGKYDYGANPYLTATPATGHSFSRWSDGNTSNPRKITVSDNATYTAEFVKNKYTITVNSNDSKMGTTDGAGTYDYGTVVKISANENPTYKFVSWDDGETNRSRIFTVTDNKTYTAIFDVTKDSCSHNYSDWIIDRDATCTERGLQHCVCSICENRMDDVIPEKGHNYGEYIIDREPTCTEKGKKHRVCDRCNADENAEIDKSGHFWDWKIVRESTCTKKGLKKIACLFCDETIDIGATELDLAPHTYEWVVDEEATCTADGHRYKKCTVCGDIPTEETEDNIIPATGHNMVEYVDDECCEPSNSSPGIRKQICSYCQDQNTVITEYYYNTIEKGVIKVSDIFCDIGGEVSIPVIIEDNPGFSGFNICIDYDRDVLLPKSITKGELLGKNGTFYSNINQAKSYTNTDLSVGFYQIKNITGNGTLFVVTFDVIANTEPGEYDINVICTGNAPDGINYDDEKGETEIITNKYYNIVNANDDWIIPECKKGIVTTSVKFYEGDVNQDLRVTIGDVIYIMKHCIDWEDLKWTELHERAADLHHDGEINVKDSNRLLMLLTNKNITGETPQTQSINLFSDESKSANIKIGSGSAKQGEYVYIPICITNNDGISSYEIRIKYDKTKLLPVEILGDNTDNIISNLEQFDNPVAEISEDEDFTTVNVCWTSNENLVGDAELFKIKFLVTDNAQTGESLTVETEKCEMCSMYATSNDEYSVVDVIPTVEKGKVTISSSVSSGEYAYAFDSVTIKSKNEEILSEIPKDKFVLDVNIKSLSDTLQPGNLIIASYAQNRKFLGASTTKITADKIANGIKENIDNTSGDITQIKLFIWDSLNGLQPLAIPYVIGNVYDYDIESVSFKDKNGGEYDKTPSTGNVTATVCLQGDDKMSPTVIAATYGEKGNLITLNSTDEISWESNIGTATLAIDKATGIATTKVFVWDSLNKLKPLSSVYITQ